MLLFDKLMSKKARILEDRLNNDVEGENSWTNERIKKDTYQKPVDVDQENFRWFGKW